MKANNELKKIGVCGHFDGDKPTSSGQIIKTRIVTGELIRQLGKDQVMTVDSSGGAKAMPRMLKESWGMFKQCENIVFLPAYKGLRVFAPAYSFYNAFYHRKIHYVVIGGWLNSFIDQHKWLAGMLKNFSGIYVETTTMKKALEKRGFRNVVVMPNFKNLEILKPEELSYTVEQPYKLCSFSRVMKKKGIEDAIEAVKAVNEKAGHTVYTFDIYGQIDDSYKEEFGQSQKIFPSYVQYKGLVPYDKSVDVLKNYFALLFPTQFYTEGIPGTIIDAYAAGVPVISSEWESFADVVDDNVTGIGYEFKNNDELIKILENIAADPSLILSMKKNCLTKAEDFTAKYAIGKILVGGGTSRKINNLQIIRFDKEAEIPEPQPYRLYTFSRVMKEKGIEDAINAVKAVNKTYGRTVFTLDIFGQVDDGYKEKFSSMQKSFPSYVRYAGLVSYDKSVETIKTYFALLFPTYYHGEGFAGTLIDAMAAGTPAIASDWRFNKEVVRSGETGVLIKDCNAKKIEYELIKIVENPDEWNAMKVSTLEEAHRYEPETAIKPLMDRIG